MTEHQPIDPGHNATRDALRVLGPLVFVVGGLFMLVGVVDFFSSFGSMRPPTMFWCCFVGMPLMGIGGALTKAGFAGKIVRYYSQELTPAATDTFNYAARETKDSIRDIADAIGDGLRGDHVPGGAPMLACRCPRCSHDNSPEARFCSQCGVALNQQIACPTCQAMNDPDAKFCDKCGKPLG